MSDNNNSNKSAQGYQDTGDPHFEKIGAEFRSNAPLATIEARLKKAEEEIDNIDLRLDGSVREKNNLEAAYKEAMLNDKVKRAREEVLVQKKREEDIKMGKTRSTQPFDQLEREIMGRPSGWKK